MIGNARTLDRNDLRSRLAATVAIVVSASILAAGIAAMVAFDRAVEPELAQRTRLIGSIIRGEVQRALGLGVPMEAIVGLDRYLAEILDKFHEVDEITVTASSGQTVAAIERGEGRSILARSDFFGVFVFGPTRFVLPILDGNGMVGEIRIGISQRFLERRLRHMFLDVIVIALVAMVVALELSLAVAVNSVAKPLERVLRLLGEQRNGNFLHGLRPAGPGSIRRVAVRFNDHAQDLAERLAALPDGLRTRFQAESAARIATGIPSRFHLSDVGDIRLALFLFAVATEIAAAFLPLYARAADRPPWLSAELAAAAPLVVYLIGVAALSPFGGALARRFGPRRLFLASVPPTAIALAAMGSSDSVVEVALWRGVIAVFYATATIACQEYAIRADTDRGGARSAGAFFVVVYGGVFCGSALGGLLAARFGHQAAFLSGAALAAVAGGLAWAAMRGPAGEPAPANRFPPAKGGVTPISDARFAALLLGIAVPMSATTAIVVWYLTPLILAADGSDAAGIARVVMLYYLAAVVFGPTVAKMVDARAGPVPLIVVGSLLSAAGLLSLTLWTGSSAVAASITALGVGHTIARAPLYAHALRIALESRNGMGALRFSERMGAIIGLALSALLFSGLGAMVSVRALALLVLAGVGLHVIVERVCRGRTD